MNFSGWLNRVSQNDKSLVLVNVTLFGNTVFMDIIKVKILGGDNSGFRFNTKFMIYVLIRERRQ